MLPATGPALVAHAAGDLRIDEVPLPRPAADEAVVEVLYGGICGSDLHYWLHGAAGESILKAPLVLGHEISGVVVRAAANGAGPQPEPPSPSTPQRRVQAPRAIRRTGPTCHRAARTWAALPVTRTRIGAFSRYVTLPVRMLRPLPDSIDLRTAALIEPASVAWHAVSRAGDVSGKTALVIGSGPIGALAVAVLSAQALPRHRRRSPSQTAGNRKGRGRRPGH